MWYVPTKFGYFLLNLEGMNWGVSNCRNTVKHGHGGNAPPCGGFFSLIFCGRVFVLYVERKHQVIRGAMEDRRRRCANLHAGNIQGDLTKLGLILPGMMFQQFSVSGGRE